MQKMEINVGGDFYLNDKFYSKDLINTQVIDFFKNSDLNVINIESPIS
jgi:hypothetical protein